MQLNQNPSVADENTGSSILQAIPWQPRPLVKVIMPFRQVYVDQLVSDACRPYRPPVVVGGFLL
jgi:hypothetical protein